VNVHQLLSGAGPVDAVTAQALAYRRLFTEWGWGGADAAVHLDPRVNGSFLPPRELRAADEDVLLFHYSAYAPRLRPWLGRPNPKLLVYHNVTPARYLWGYEPVVAIHCAVGRSQLPDFAGRVDLAAAVSEYNARELAAAGAAETAVVPILFEPTALGPPADPPTGPPTVLCVGRLTPHKRQDLVLRAFALYRRAHAPDARLRLVGEALSERFRAQLADLAQRLAPGAVTIESSLTPEELGDRYRAAHAFLTLSEHEGFCVPLLESFHFGVPVIARPIGGVPEVAGDAALLTDDEDLAVVAELLHLAVTDTDLRAELRRRGRERLAAFAPDATAAKLRAAVERITSATPASPVVKTQSFAAKIAADARRCP
jgi:glycosyltransferase involved in cell wall biosynthesis